MTEEISPQTPRLKREGLRRLQRSESRTSENRSDRFPEADEDYFRYLVENTTDIIAIIEEDGMITYMNPVSQRLLGYDEEELIGANIFAFIHEDDLSLMKGCVSSMIADPNFEAGITIRCRNKYQRWLFLEGTGKTFQRGQAPRAMLLSLWDVTARKEAETMQIQKENYYRSLVVNPSDMISVFDEDLRIIWASAAVGLVTGYKPEDAFGKSLFDFVPPEDWDSLKEFFDGELGDPYSLAAREIRLRHKDGSYHCHEGVFVNRLQDPAVKGFLVNSRDVTEEKARDEDLKKYRDQVDLLVLERTGELEEINKQLRWEIAERKRVEAQLRRSVAYDRAFLENVTDMVFVLDEDLTMRFAGPSLQELLGYDVGELIGESVFDFLHPEDVVIALEAVRESFEKPGEPLLLRLRARHRDGTWHYLECVGRNLITDPVMKGFVISARDMTERQAAEESLRESEERYRTLIDEMNDMVISWDPDGTLNFVAPTISNHFQYSPEELIGKNIRDFIHPDEVMDSLTRVERLGQGEFVGPDEYRILDKDGSYRYVNISSRALKSNGKITMYVSVMSDVNEKKRAEQALTESESKYRALFEASKDAIVIVNDKSMEILDCNRAALETYGYEPDEMKKLVLFDLVTPEAREESLRQREALLSQDQFYLETTHVRKDGSRFPAEVVVGKATLADAKYAIAFIRDISQRRSAEEALKESEARYRSLFETTIDAIFIAESGGLKIVDCNLTATNMFGYNEDELLGMTFYDLSPPGTREQAVLERRTDANTGHTYLQPILLKKDSSKFPAEVFYTLAKIGGSEYVVVFVKDITERKRVEEALKESEEKFRLISEQSLMGLMIIQDDENKFVNQAAADIFEVTVEEAIARKRFNDFLHPDDKKFVIDQIIRKQKGEGGQINNYSYRIITKSGKQKCLEIYSKTIIFNGRPADLVTMSDISGRVYAQDELKQREEYFRSIIQNSIDGVVILSNEGKLTFVSQAVEEILGYSVSEVLDLNWLDVIHPDDLEKATAPLEGWEVSGARVHTELRTRRKDGTYRDIEISAVNLVDDPAVNGIVANFRDVTEQKKIGDRMERINHLFLSLGADLIYNMIKIVETGKEILGVPMMAYSRMEKGKFSTLSTQEGEDSLFITDQPEDFIAFRVISGKRDKPWMISDVSTMKDAADDLFVLKYGYKSFLGYPVLGKNDVIGCLCIFDDQTRYFSHEELELMGMLARALSVEEERLSQEQSLKDFIDVASHELRHPITLMKGYSLTLRDYGSRLNDDARQEYLTIIGQGADRLDMLIKELLDVSRIERGRFALNKHLVRLEPLIERAVGEMRGKGCSDRFNVSIPEELPPRNVDPEKIVRVMVVLLDNAVTHTPERTDIDIFAEEKGALTTISVMDHGLGIPEQDRERIFERFYQVEDALHHSAPGMGLGLYIAQEIVEAHGGKIWHEPRDEGGSIFRFTLPGPLV